MASAAHRLRFRRDHRWTPGHLSAFVDGDLPERARARVIRHIRECPECRAALRGLERMLERLRALPASPPDEGRAADIARAVRRRMHDDPPHGP
jgi:anti-sigma factor RsiW